MTNGSTIACHLLALSSVSARQNETAAAPSRILTRRSSNCAKISLSHDVGGSSGMEFGPKRARRRSASARERPAVGSTARMAAVSSALRACASVKDSIVSFAAGRVNFGGRFLLAIHMNA